jgi:hypothetical protein
MHTVAQELAVCSQTSQASTLQVIYVPENPDLMPPRIYPSFARSTSAVTEGHLETGYLSAEKSQSD